MANFAVIENNIVINVIIADSKEVAEEISGLNCFDLTDGWDYDNGLDGGHFFPTPTIEESTEN